jgi:CRP/FNR family transcriptional regulator, cyclic AMP receptor protein
MPASAAERASRSIWRMQGMLALTARLPEQTFAAGDTVIAEGASARALWVLVAGALQISKAGVVVTTVSSPGALIGEVAALLGSSYGATVIALQPSLLRRADDARAWLDGDAEIMRLVAVGLAERLNFVTTYLVDLKHQYGDAPGLSMVPEVLHQLAQRPAPMVRSGSARDPDPVY